MSGLRNLFKEDSPLQNQELKRKLNNLLIALVIIYLGLLIATEMNNMYIEKETARQVELSKQYVKNKKILQEKLEKENIQNEQETKTNKNKNK